MAYLADYCKVHIETKIGQSSLTMTESFVGTEVQSDPLFSELDKFFTGCQKLLSTRDAAGKC